jgi:GNAT superfamily N-acetyltransferase
MRVEFHSNLNPTPRQWGQLKAAVEEGHQEREFYLSMNGLLTSKTVGLAALTLNSNILAFAFYSDRQWVYEKNFFWGRSLGLISTVGEYRGKGYARKLMDFMADLATEKRVDFLYLQGIRDFYNQFNFRGFAPKRKFIFDLNLFSGRSFSLEQVTVKHYGQIKKIYETYASAFGCFVSRSEEQWADFFGSLSSTFLFHKPIVILNGKSRCVGYFCTSPTDPTQIKEVAFEPDQENALLVLTALSKYTKNLGSSNLEIYAPAHGSLYEMCLNGIESEFVCYFRPSSSNMIRQLCERKLPQPLLESFIFQGDNL